MITLESLQSLGCYINAGHLDHYDGHTHTRLGDVTSAGDMLLDDAGLVYANKLHLGLIMDAMASPPTASVAEPVAEPVVEPVVEPVAPSAADQELAQLMS